ncbi:MAG TPA: hypothetical protein VJR29_11345 [bacterium]|nr:hypothetical protein [bacterium]
MGFSIFSHHESWTIAHGLLFGTLYLIAFAGGLDALWNLRPGILTEEGIRKSIKRVQLGLWTMAVASWLTVITGTYVVYVWYRAKIPGSPRSRLLSEPATAFWHTFGMEWKEHLSWIVPILTTAAAFIVSRYGQELVKNRVLHSVVLWFLLVSSAMAGIGALLGAFINKVAPFI